MSTLSSQWQCGICREAFPTEELAVQHSRSKHAERAAKLVRVSATTWRDNRHSLFDREDIEQHHHQTILLPLYPANGPFRFVRRGTQIYLDDESSSLHDPTASPMHTQLAWGPFGPIVASTPTGSSHNWKKRIWIDVGEAGRALQRGDRIKLGCYIIHVRQICLSGHRQVPSYSSVKDAGTIPVRNMQSPCEDSACRICLDSGDSVEDGPMILAPCLCRGGVQHVHLECLRRWLGTRYSVVNRMQGQQQAWSEPVQYAENYTDTIQSQLGRPPSAEDRLRTQHGDVITFAQLAELAGENLQAAFPVQVQALLTEAMDCPVALSFKPPGCEICKTEYPAMYQAKGPDRMSTALLPALPEVEPPFIVLSLPKSQDLERPHGERCVFSPGGTDATLRLGRAREAELLLKDNSVSRIHASISFRRGSFVLMNNNAKFGTTVLPVGPEAVQEEPLSIQAGRTLLRFAMEG
eukprot:TRINITY_DN25674_c0_g1_i1.p1 TRINITY_DN25674_c0_g1~~TRINITY_DN25674_c0_g1_i1.p1  ORF type:complete len:465 (+),score=41.17 TRINITY_DN25674_c0_g1_i1:89-1483(+)